MTEPPEDVEARINAAIARALGPGAADGAPFRMGDTPGWDSMGHMAIVLELEREFAIRFPTHRLPQLIDVASIARVIRETASA